MNARKGEKVGTWLHETWTRVPVGVFEDESNRITLQIEFDEEFNRKSGTWKLRLNICLDGQYDIKPT